MQLRNVEMHDVSRILASKHNRRWVLVRYAMALLSVLAAVCMTLVLQNMLGERPTLFLLFAAIVFSGWTGGAGAGIFAVLLALPAGLYFYSHNLNSLALKPADIVLMVLFLFCAIAGGLLSSWQRRANNDVALKAIQLEVANDVLRKEIAERRRAEQALLETRGELARVARLTTIGELAASIAHEINQPLAAITTSAGACIRWLSCEPPNLQEAHLSASWIARDAERAAAVVSRVRQLVRKSFPEKSEIDVNASVTEIQTLLENEFRKHGIRLSTHLAADLPRVDADGIQLQQVFLNIFMNAIDAMSKSASGNRTLATRSYPEGDAVVVEIQDSGPGFDGPADRLFEPFFTTKPHGMGLGLSICRSILESHGGILAAESVPNRGTVFRITLLAKAA